MKKLLSVFVLTLGSMPLHAQDFYIGRDKATGYLGYYLADGTNVVKPQFCSASFEMDGYYVVTKAEHAISEDKYGVITNKHLNETERYGVLNSKGEMMINFDNDYNFIGIEEGVIKVFGKSNIGVVNDKGVLTVPLKYNQLRVINANIIVVKTKDKLGLIDAKNTILVPFIYDSIGTDPFQKATDTYYFIVKKDSKTGVINQKGESIIALQNENIIYVFDRTYLACNAAGSYAFFDYQNKQIAPYVYYDDSYYDNESAVRFYLGKTAYWYSTAGQLQKQEEIIELMK